MLWICLRLNKDVIMKQNDFENLDNYLDQYDLANILNVYNDSKLGSFSITYNMNRTLNILDINNIDNSYFNTYTVNDNDTLIAISYKIYKTTRLWWLIAKMNGFYDPTQTLNTGINLKILKAEYISSILDNIRNQ